MPAETRAYLDGVNRVQRSHLNDLSKRASHDLGKLPRYQERLSRLCRLLLLLSRKRQRQLTLPMQVHACGTCCCCCSCCSCNTQPGMGPWLALLLLVLGL
jgi:hypothetical protein